MIYRSPYPDVVIPEVSVVDYVLRRAPEFGEKAALIDAVTLDDVKAQAEALLSAPPTIITVGPAGA